MRLVIFAGELILGQACHTKNTKLTTHSNRNIESKQRGNVRRFCLDVPAGFIQMHCVFNVLTGQACDNIISLSMKKHPSIILLQ